MIVSTIKQFGLRLRADPEEIPFQHSANVQMQFIKDENYNDYTVVGYYIPPGENEAKLLSINDDGKFILGPDCFKQRGTLSFSFNLINSQEEVHLGSIDFEIRYAFGDSDTILPEPEEVWISLVTKVAEDAIKEDVELVKQKAKEASQSALTASEKANEALEYANNANQSADSASLSASSALTAKTDAIAASNSAIQAKQDAEQSANNAKNSADTALANANKSNEAIKTVTQIKTEIENKANDFDTNYQEKLKSFNDNATSKQNAFDNSVQTANTNLDNKVNQANSDLNAKVQEANTIIDEKVKTATEQAQKATDEANRAEQATDGKLDKNLGSENSDKVLITDAEGNVITQSKEDFEGGGTSDYNDLENKPQINGVELKGNKTSGDLKMYTQEEVDYMLADKMDKPYVSIEITDSATIDDALAGNFKIDKIKGNTYQKVETNIVPTPSRPVPINSRKVKVGDEYVELRSLKESVNKFDLGLLSQTYLIPQTGSYRKIEIPTKLKPGVRYTFYYENFMTPALSWLVLNIINSTGNIIFSAFNVDNKNNEEIKVNGRSIAFNAPSSGEIYFDYYVQSYDAEGNLVPQSTEMFKENWFTKYVKNIMITEESLNQTTYIAPTVRDYKIVDHANKTSKIVRNTFELLLTGDENWQLGNAFGDLAQYFFLPTQYVSDASNNVKNTHFIIDNPYDKSKDCLGFYIRDVRIRYEKLSGNIENLKQWLNENNVRIIGKLQTPTEESIPYLETDTSEVGYSWQDTTSPSLTIPSEVKGVEEVDILKTGKNLFDVESAKNKLNWTESIRQAGYIDFVIKVKKGSKYTFSYRDKLNIGLEMYVGVVNEEDITNNIITNWFYHKTSSSLISNCLTFIAKGDYISLRVNEYGFNILFDNLQNIQLELGDTATTYEPYTEQRINITLQQPLYENDVANVESENYEYEMQKYVVTGDEVFIQDYQKKSGYYGRYFNLKNGMGLETDKVFCNCLNYVQSIWNSESEGVCQNSNIQIHLKFSNDRLGITDNTPVEEKRTAFANYLKQLYASGDPLYIVIKVAKTTQPIPQEDLAKLKSLKTNSGINNIFINSEVKSSIEARYPQDVILAVNKLQTKLLTLQEEVVKNV
jgi:hypothetical protein